MLYRWSSLSLGLCALATIACRDAASGDPPSVDAPPQGGADARVDAPPVSGDGPPMRVTCTNTLGTGLSNNTFGRLDGILVSVVVPGTAGCNSDRTHLHLQVEVSGSTYDIAVNLGNGTPGDVATTVRSKALAQPWQEGWHPGYTFDYVTDLGLSSVDFTPHTQAEVFDDLMAALLTVNHISVYATGYGPDGAHLIHRVTTAAADDGALVLQPRSAAPQLKLFRFGNQAFP
jgi:hypothetical protein